MTYVSGFLAAVPEENKSAYLASARKSWPLFRDYGATEMRECWEDLVPDGEVTSFPMAVKRQDGEKVVFSWILWPDRESAERCWQSMETDPRWKEMEMPFDGKRMMWGSFETLFKV